MDNIKINEWYGPAKLKAHLIIEISDSGNGKTRCGKRVPPTFLTAREDTEGRCANCVKLGAPVVGEVPAPAQEPVEPVGAPGVAVETVAKVLPSKPVDKDAQRHQEAVEAAKENAATRKERYGSGLSEKKALTSMVGTSDDNGARCGGLAASSPDPVVPRIDGAAFLPIGETGMAGVRPDPEIVNTIVGGEFGWLHYQDFKALGRSAQRRYQRTVQTRRERARQAKAKANQNRRVAEAMRGVKNR